MFKFFRVYHNYNLTVFINDIFICSNVYNYLDNWSSKQQEGLWHFKKTIIHFDRSVNLDFVWI